MGREWRVAGRLVNCRWMNLRPRNSSSLARGPCFTAEWDGLNLSCRNVWPAGYVGHIWQRHLPTSNGAVRCPCRSAESSKSSSHSGTRECSRHSVRRTRRQLDRVWQRRWTGLVNVWSRVQNSQYSRLIIPTYRGLRCSDSPLLTATGLVNGKCKLRPHTESTPSTDRYIFCQVWCKSVHAGFCGNGWNITKPFFGTRLQVDRFSRLMTQTTRSHVRLCLSAYRWYCSPFMRLNLQKATFWAWIGIWS